MIPKFRVWDKEKGEMIEWEDISFHPLWWFKDNPTKEFMISTGLHDKNGKEIWEGDVVTIHDGRNEVIIWEDAGFRMEDGTIFCQDRAKRWEVIGNIYENPELLIS